MNILSSAAKIVFLLIAITACLGFFFGKLTADDFMKLALMAFAFYFSYKGEPDSTIAGSGK